GKMQPSWLEVRSSGFHNLIGEFVGVVGGARSVSKINFSGDKFSFSIPPQWEQGNNDLSFEGTVQGNKLQGTMTAPDGKQYPFTASKAPFLHSQTKPSWGSPVRLFNGKDLDGWHAMGQNQWIAENGVL